MNVIAVTAYNKPDLLYLYLEQLARDERLYEYKVRIHTEEGFDPLNEVVINDFSLNNPHVDIQLIVKPKVNCPLIGFHNILSSYTMSADEASDFVIIGEEDMLPTADYIRFNERCYQDFLSKYDKIFCVAHKRRPEIETPGRTDVLIGDYQLTSPSCISVKAINKYIRPVIEHPLFFRNPVQYYFSFFDSLRIPHNTHTHHDGALERIMLANNLFAIKPDQARSCHVGLSGIFCKGYPPIGTLADRIEEWRGLVKDGPALRARSSMPQDLAVVDLDGFDWNSLVLDLDRTEAIGSNWFYDEFNNFSEYIRTSSLSL